MTTRRGRPPKHSDAEARSRLLGVGLEFLIDHGLVDGLPLLKLDWAAVSTRVPRGAAYRLFQNLDNYRHHVILHAIATIPSGQGLAATAQLVEDMLSELEPELESGDATRIAAARDQIIRQSTALNFSLLDQSPPWQLFRAIVLTAQTSDNSELIEAITEAESNLIQLYADFFERFAHRVHLKRRDHVEATEFAMAAYAINDGLANRTSAIFRRYGYTYGGSTNTPEEWSLLGLGFHALVQHFYQPID